MSESKLKEMLRAAEVLDDGPHIIEFKIREALIKSIRRAIEVVEGCDPGSKRFEIVDMILKDAGMER